MNRLEEERDNLADYFFDQAKAVNKCGTKATPEEKILWLAIYTMLEE